MVLNYAIVCESQCHEPFYILYVRFHKDRNYRQKYNLPPTDQWHVYGNKGDIFPLCISQDYEKLCIIWSLLRQFPLYPNYLSVDIKNANDFMRKYYSEDEEDFYENIYSEYFYFETCLNHTSLSKFPIQLSIHMLEYHLNNEELFLQTENTIEDDPEDNSEDDENEYAIMIIEN